MPNILFGSRGSALVMVTGGLAVASALLAIVISQGQGQLQDSLSNRNRQRAQEQGEQAMALGAYLVSSNFILCREQGWKGLDRLCRWGGVFVSPNVAIDTYGLSEPETETSTLTYISNEQKARLSFNLMDSSRVKNLVGSVSEAAEPVDKDDYFIFMTAQVDYLDAAGKTNSVELTGAIRRPLGTPAIELPDSPQCPAVCEASDAENPYPECRSAQATPEKGEASGEITVTNYGPGPLYRLRYKKIVSYDPDYFPGHEPNPEISTFNAMPSDEVLMPGQSIVVSDSYPCVQPKSIVKNVSSSVNCSRVFGTCGASGTTTSINVHEEEVADVRYDFDFRNLAENIEPAKLARMIGSVSGDVDQKITETTNVTITYIPTH